jgi:lysophospholipase L1-like esterase
MILKTFLLLVLVYLVVDFGIFFYKYEHLPVLPAIDQSDKTLGSGPTLRYIAAGDSTGVGYGASSLEDTYAYKIAEFLAGNHTVFYKNISVIGNMSQDVLDRQVSQIISYKPDIVTISMGANDATHLVASEKVLENYKTIIEKLEQETTAKIYITDIANFDDATILPWLYYKLIEYRSGMLNPRLLALDDLRVKMIDIHNFGWSKPPYNDRGSTYAADHFHPNDLGYRNWTDAFLDKIQNRL